MPNWRKVLVSGSDASLNTLNVANGITGSLFGTASYAVTASYVNPLHQIVQITSSTTAASLLGSGSGLLTVDGTHGRIFTIDDTISGSLFSVVTGSTPILEVFSSELVVISGSLNVSNGITGSLFGTASWAISSSYALTASYVSGSSNSAVSASYALSASYAVTSSYAFAFPDQGFGYTQSPGSTTWTIVHGLNTRIPLVDVYDSSYNQLIPAGVVSIDANTIEITFSTAQAGYAIISKGSGINSDLAVSASYALSASYAVSASYAPGSDTSISASYALSSSYASNSSNATSASYADNSISASYALTASYSNNSTSASYANNATTASYVENAQTASYVLNAISASYALTSSYAVSASYAITSSYSNNSTTSSYANNSTSASYANSSTSASYAITSSYSNTSTSASYALTASYLSGYVSPFPYTGSAIISGSLTVTGSFNTTGSTILSGKTQINTPNIEAGDGNSLLINASTSGSYALVTGTGNALQIVGPDAGVGGSTRVTIDAYGSGVRASPFINARRARGTVDNPEPILEGDSLLRLTGTGWATASYNGGIAFSGPSIEMDATENFNSSSFGASVSIYAVPNGSTDNVLVGTFDGYGLQLTGSLRSSGSFTSIGSWNLTGSLDVSGSNTLVGDTSLTGSLLVSGSTTQIGNNTLLGNTILSGSIIISGSQGQPNPTISVFGDLNQTGYTRYLPVTNNLDNSISASYIYVSGSTQDLYFSQNSKGYSNSTRLRWIEGNLYTGLLNGGVITSQSSTVYQVSSGSGIIVTLNASLNDNPYPTIQYLNWSNLTANISSLTASYQQAFVGIQSDGTIYQQGTPITAVQNDSLINIGNVLFQNGSTINGVKTQPYVAYGLPERQDIFTSAFGPLKLSGYTLAVSASSTGSVIVGSGTAYADGANYTTNPNSPSYVVDSGTNVSKIFRYYDSGSTWIYNTNGGAGYGSIDPTRYSNNGVLSTVGNANWSIQRVFWYPNSVTKAVVVYYGNAIYPTQADATANLPYEYFVEAPNTAANAIYLGAIIARGNADFTVANSYAILPGGLFRQVGGSGGGGSVVTQTLTGLSDVAISGPTNLQPFVYSTTAAKWINSSIISASIVGNASTATSASYATSGSYSLTATSSSYAMSASYAPDTTFPYTGTAVITGSLVVTSAIALDGTLNTTSTVTPSIVGVNNVFIQATGSYTSAFFKYTVSNGANARAGEVMAVWNGATTNYTDTSTTDIGSTSAVTCSAEIVGSDLQFNITTGTSGWTLKSLATYI